MANKAKSNIQTAATAAKKKGRPVKDRLKVGGTEARQWGLNPIDSTSASAWGINPTETLAEHFADKIAERIARAQYKVAENWFTELPSQFLEPQQSTTGNIGQAVATVQRSPQAQETFSAVFQELSALTVTVEQLEASLGMLVGKLAPVLKNQPVMCKDQTSSPVPTVSPISGAIAESVGRLAVLRDRIMELAVERVDL